MGGDRQSTWEHMAPTNNKPCAQHTETSGGQPGHTSRIVTGRSFHQMGTVHDVLNMDIFLTQTHCTFLTKTVIFSFSVAQRITASHVLVSGFHSSENKVQKLSPGTKGTNMHHLGTNMYPLRAYMLPLRVNKVYQSTFFLTVCLHGQ